MMGKKLIGQLDIHTYERSRCSPQIIICETFREAFLKSESSNLRTLKNLVVFMHTNNHNSQIYSNPTFTNYIRNATYLLIDIWLLSL
ncbi:unnamed protein product [Schistosoma guineensis]|nr:unnamed protein product [Schistosoma guineensis]